MLNGVKPSVFFIMPMLGHHPDRFPRFRDCFVGDESHPEYDDCIHVYTRTGGGNRDMYESGNKWITSPNGYITNFDDEGDSTYASWVFKVPEKWKADFDAFCEGRLDDISVEYRNQIRIVFPKLEDKLRDQFGWYNDSQGQIS